jgi:hypothetical protein
MLCLQFIDSGWAQDKIGDYAGANAQPEDSLDLRGACPTPATRRVFVTP